MNKITSSVKQMIKHLTHPFEILHSDDPNFVFVKGKNNYFYGVNIVKTETGHKFVLNIANYKISNTPPDDLNGPDPEAKPLPHKTQEFAKAKDLMSYIKLFESNRESNSQMN